PEARDNQGLPRTGVAAEYDVAPARAGEGLLQSPVRASVRDGVLEFSRQRARERLPPRGGSEPDAGLFEVRVQSRQRDRTEPAVQAELQHGPRRAPYENRGAREAPEVRRQIRQTAGELHVPRGFVRVEGAGHEAFERHALLGADLREAESLPGRPGRQVRRDE